MKILLCALMLGISGLGHLSAQNGAIRLDEVKLTGSITVTPMDPEKNYVVIPITKTNLLKYFGPEGVKASEAFYFTDATASRLLLASKDATTLYVTVAAPVSDPDQSAFVAGKSNTKLRIFAQLALMNGIFTGYGSETAKLVQKPTGTLTTVKAQFFGAGAYPTDGNTKAIVSGSFSFTAKLPPLNPPQ